MPRKLTIVSDFVCPYCYWLEVLLDRLEEPPEVTHVPFQLTEPPEPRVDVWNDPVRRARYAETLGPACQAQGVEMHLPPRVIPRPYTDLAFQGWCFAEERGRGEPFYRAVFRAYFVEERDIGDPAVLTELAEGCGLPGEDFRTALETGAYAETVRRESCLSREALGIRMVPTILAGDKRLEGFVPDLDALQAWLDEVRREA